MNKGEVMEKVPREEVELHVSRFQNALREQSLDSALILQGADMFYLSGTVQDGVLCVPVHGEPHPLIHRVFSE